MPLISTPILIVFFVWLTVVFSGSHLDASEGSASVASWIKQLAHSIAGQRARAAAELANRGEGAESAVEPLIECLSDANADVRLYASFALGRIASKPAKSIAALTKLLDDNDEHVQYSAAWSIARIARRLNAATLRTVDDAHSLARILDQANEGLINQGHQPRHRAAIQDALAAITAQIAQLQPTEAPNAKQSEELEQSQQRAKKEIARTLAEFRDGNLLGRLQLLERIATQEANLELRSSVLTEALIVGDTRTIRYAMRRWGEAAQQILKAKLDGPLDYNQLPGWTIQAVAHLLPNDSASSSKLLLIAQSPQCSESLRCAALSRLACKSDASEGEVDVLSRLVANRNEDEPVRVAAIECLSALGSQAEPAVPTLNFVLRDAMASTTLRGESAAAIGRIAPHHTAALREILATLAQLDVNDYFYGDLIEAVGYFGPNGIEAAQFCVDGMNSQDEIARRRCAETIGKIGPAATSAIPALVARVIDVNESIGVKLAVAKSIRFLGPSAIEAIGLQANHSQSEIREDVLRVLAACGQDARLAMPGCIARLVDERELPRVRALAASAVGNMGEFAGVAVPTLLEIIESEVQSELRAAALIALAQVSPTSRGEIAPFATSSDVRIRACAAFALHLRGETSKSLQLLLDMIDGAAPSEMIEAAIKDIGVVALPTLLQTARDARASDAKRLACLNVAVQLERTDWAPLLDTLGDERLGEDFYQGIVKHWSFDFDILPDLVSRLADPVLTADARGRMERLIDYVTSELGSAQTEQVWEGGFALTSLDFASDELDAELATRAPAHAMAAPAHTESDYVPMPSFTPPESDFQESIATLQPADDPRLVRVFYGTNRVANSSFKDLLELAPPIAAALGIALATIIYCVAMLLRLRAWRYASAAFIGLVAIGYFGSHAISTRHPDNSWTNTRVEYGGRMGGHTELGLCEVSIPENHQPGELEAPTLLRLEIEKDPDKHIVLQSTESLTRDDFYRLLHADLERRGKNLLVFVHGYNVSFEDAARRTAQMAYDLEFPGAPVFFSWPSQANWYRYAKDKENIRLSVGQIKAFLQDLAVRSNAETINLVAHSMGTVGLTAALQEIEQDGKETLFNQVVLAAPDIDANIFKQQIAPNIVTKAKHVTLYTSQTDLALIASRYFNNGARAGDSGAEVIVYPGIDTIDASAVDTSLLGHSYYGSNVSVLHDVGQLLKGQPIEARGYLRSASAGNQPYWLFDPSKIARQTTSTSIPSVR